MKLILILADGVSADYFAAYRGRFPNLAKLAREGAIIERLASDIPAVSFPARVTMVTGKSPTEHGVYGNKIYDGSKGKFRYVGPHDFEVDTLAKLAKAKGLVVANVGYGMVPAEDSHLYDPPWWLNDYVYKSRVVDPEKAAENPGWVASLHHRDELGLWDLLRESQLPTTLPDPQHFRHADVRGIAAELQTTRWVAALATSDRAPDLVLTEWSMTDELQHMTGFASDASHMAVALTDLYVGELMARLAEAGKADDYAIAVVADHGHKAFATAIYPEAFLPEGTPFAAEGMQLLIYGAGESTIADAERAFEKIGVKRFDDYLPPPVRGEVASFLAPEGCAFEDRPADQSGATGPVQYLSNHGLTPGDPADDRLCLFGGAGIPQVRVASGKSVQLMPTCAKILGINLPSHYSPSLF